jgi:HAAS
MTPLTERYLAAALRGIPEKQRADVERELSSSIADAVEDRIAAGEDRAAAEKAVLEGLGDPIRLAAGMADRPLHLIGPEMFIAYRQLLVTLLSVIVPIVAVIQVAVEIYEGDDFIGALLAGLLAGWAVAVNIFFWVTIIFALLERLEDAREARDEITGGPGPWTIDRLPTSSAAQISASETVGEIVTTVISIGILIFLYNADWFTDADGNVIPFFNPDLWYLWLPAFIALFVALAGLQVVVFLVGRWTTPLAVANGVLQLAFALPLLALALSGSLINPEFAQALGYPPLAEGTGPVMLALAVTVVLVTGWNFINGFRRARRGRSGVAVIGEPGPAST